MADEFGPAIELTWIAKSSAALSLSAGDSGASVLMSNKEGEPDLSLRSLQKRSESGLFFHLPDEDGNDGKTLGAVRLQENLSIAIDGVKAGAK